MLVDKIRETSVDADLTFDETFNEKKLRDRIRCFYKTHLQNAKKRLGTLQKHPDWEEHQTALKVYIRAVRQNLTVEESQKLEPNLKLKYQHQHQRTDATGATITTVSVENRRSFGILHQQQRDEDRSGSGTATAAALLKRQIEEVDSKSKPTRDRLDSVWSSSSSSACPAQGGPQDRSPLRS